MKKSFSFYILHFAFAVVIAFFSVDSTAADNPGAVELTAIASSGVGCPLGSVRALLSPDASVLTILYDQFTLSVETNAGAHTSNCDVQLNLHKAIDVGLSIDAMDFRGFVMLEEGMSADQQVVVSSGTNKARKATSEFGSQIWKGPVSGEYLLTAVKSKQMPEVLDCVPPRENTLINISSQLRIQSARPASGALTVDSADGHLEQRYHLNWHGCKKGNGKGHAKL